MSESLPQNHKLEERDYRGRKEPSYDPIGLRWLYWSDCGDAERDKFLRKREPRLDEVKNWLQAHGYQCIPMLPTNPDDEALIDEYLNQKRLR